MCTSSKMTSTPQSHIVTIFINYLLFIYYLYDFKQKSNFINCISKKLSLKIESKQLGEKVSDKFNKPAYEKTVLMMRIKDNYLQCQRNER